MKKIIPRDLTVEQINPLFKACLATENSKNIIRVVLFQKEQGFEQDSRAIFFDGDKINLAKPQLEYSLGQSKDAHLKNTFTTTDTITDRYDGEKWTTSTPAILAYLHMLLAAELIAPVDPKTAKMHFKTEIIPTYLLTDPQFVKWIKENEPKLSEKYYGKEPADD